MIYGINFNGQPIPRAVAQRFAGWTVNRPHGNTRVRLQGVCNQVDELKAMRSQADNGHRTFMTVGPRKVEGAEWYAFYCN